MVEKKTQTFSERKIYKIMILRYADEASSKPVVIYVIITIKLT